MSFKKHKEDEKNLNALKDMLNTKRKFDRTIIRFDGVYALYDTAVATDGSGRRAYNMYFLDRFFGFYKNGMVLRSVVVSDSLESVDYFKNFMLDENKAEAGQAGVFNIINDTIDIVCYNDYWVGGGHFNYFLTHFKGIIKNADTITNLKIVPPYPDVKLHYKLLRKHFNEMINQTQMLVFKPFPAKTLVDSNNFWINKYK